MAANDHKVKWILRYDSSYGFLVRLDKFGKYSRYGWLEILVPINCNQLIDWDRL